MTIPRILYVDAYDSFANNIVALLETTLDARVTCVKIDDSKLFELDQEFSLGNYLSSFDAVVVGPGPGNPTLEKDVGWINRLWRLPDCDLIPVLGICLGFQSLCNAFGGQINRLREPRHGLVLQVDHNGRSLFSGLESFTGTMYHSLHVNLGHTSTTIDVYAPSNHCPYLEPLAWDLGDEMNGPVLMGAQHISKPFCGVQFHPESVVTGATIARGTIEFQAIGASLIQGWWLEAQHWNLANPRTTLCESPTISPLYSLSSSTRDDALFTTQIAFWDLLGLRGRKVKWKVNNLLHTTVQHICEELKVNRSEGAVLESGLKPDGTPLRKDTGRYSIIGLVNKETVRLQYFIESSRIVLRVKGHDISCEGSTSEFWSYLKRFMEQLKSTGGSDNIPFWGGLMGFISYEAGLTTIKVRPDRNHQRYERPDISFVLVQRSVVVDHWSNVFYTQSIKADDNEWVYDTSKQLSKLTQTIGYERLPVIAAEEIRAPRACLAPIPDFHSYCQKVFECDTAIRAGDSYELCLTNQIQIKVPYGEAHKDKSNWKLYQKLSDLNTAPFAAYIHLKHDKEDLTILSSSPERFLSWNREGRCQFRPIKGTVKKEPGMTQQDAEKILRPSLNSKDVAENLMITDLVRHDLYGVVGAGNVEVTQLFGVEEYKTVFQLVSVIEGQLPPPPKAVQEPENLKNANPHHERRNSRIQGGLATPDSLHEFELPSIFDQEPKPVLPAGIDVLSTSLPPGSMTGAPKQRSCQILQEIEEHIPRGIYSGVLGYLDVGGGGDFAVVIRTAWKWSGDVVIDEKEGPCEVWRVGAGGAVTAQSTMEGEASEMQVKLSSVTRAFEIITHEPLQVHI